ncbi:major facilitator super transporter protein [Apophysomyces ossiformis]|uniref:GPI ethanolamine phosphate transferase 2 n=1 Tax=Apophysomyces ossiformis TaxID=679940 RepID=A0A8H7ERA3_9FUNG|nr:major facilitator super transporter protein [Apophysomyces ossiformis]
MKSLSLLSLALVQLAGLTLFCKGFFPYKIYLPGFASFESAPAWPNGDRTTLIEPEFDRLVFVVVDALRNDFVFGKDSGFKFVNSLIESHTAIPFTARATAPTVTMPRIKALTTDAVLNIAESDTSSSLEFHDNWVYQLKHSLNKTIHFFGDDTWIRLLPGMFDKKDGTTSFYVTDTVQVDLNVTRHIKPDISQPDWDITILHYLGLDHVGHMGGPESKLMKPKQEEMDRAIEDIYEIVANQDAQRMANSQDSKGTLIILCGDHGMNDEGNHGGSSLGETSTALVFMSPRFESRPTLKKHAQQRRDTALTFGFPIIDQTDIVPTLASLFAFPIPKNNLGKVVTDLYRGSKSSSVLRALQLNAYQMGHLLERIIPEIANYLNFTLESKDHLDNTHPGWRYVEAFTLHQGYMDMQEETIATTAAKAYLEFIEFAQSQLASTASNYGLSDMYLGLVLIAISAIGLIYLSVPLAYTVESSLSWCAIQGYVAMAVIIFAGSMFASSFVEEEHMLWYYYIPSLYLLYTLKSFYESGCTWREKSRLGLLCILQMCLARVALGWNRGDGFVKYISPSMQWDVLAISLATPVLYSTLIIYTTRQGQGTGVSQGAGIIQTLCKVGYLLLNTLTAMFIMAYKIRTEIPDELPQTYSSLLTMEVVQRLDDVKLGRLIYNYCGASFLALSGLMYVTRRAGLLDVLQQNDVGSEPFLHLLLHMLTPLLILLSKTQNAALFTIFSMQYSMLKKWKRCSSPPTIVLCFTMTCLSHAGFFMTGHTNSIASIDLSNAYIGVEGYDTLVIGALTFFSNWSGSIWWTLASWTLISDWWDYKLVESTFFAVFLAVLSVAVTVLREHLFIWSVFSPKYLYQVAWSVLFHWLFQVLIGTAIVKFWAAPPSLTPDTEYVVAEDEESEKQTNPLEQD